MFDFSGGACDFCSSADVLARDHLPTNYVCIPKAAGERTEDSQIWPGNSSSGWRTLGRKDLKWPASMYLEGSDQHRGWFHSSLLESSGTRGRAPYESVLTHGFVVDGKGRKMSKSLGNVISPDDILKKYGVDILRLWVVASDYYDDLKLDNTILQSQTDSYRRIRNTFRYLIRNLDSFSNEEKIHENDFPDFVFVL